MLLKQKVVFLFWSVIDSGTGLLFLIEIVHVCSGANIDSAQEPLFV